MSDAPAGVAMVVLAKAPVAGRSKTRCSPPCTPEQAAALAEAALADTLAVVAAVPAARRCLVLEGPPGPWCPAGITVLPQRGTGLDERLAAAFADVGGPALLIGMDTPQVTVELLDRCLRRLARLDPGSALLGPAVDGGWWGIGLPRADDAVFLGVPMSTEQTGERQRARLEAVGYRVEVLDPLVDVDTFADARAVAADLAGSRFARAVARVDEALLQRSAISPA